jgi:hypothetical protein
MKKIIRLTERDLTRLVKRTINEMDKENILKGIIQGRPTRRREYSADDAMSEIDSHINMLGCSEGKWRLLQDLSRMVDNAQRELSEEEFDKLMDYVDNELEQEINDTCSDDEDDDDYEY